MNNADNKEPNMKLRHIITAVLLLSLMLPLLAEDWITIYNDDLSLIRSSFNLDLKGGRQKYNFDDITSRIMPSSVIVKGDEIGRASCRERV